MDALRQLFSFVLPEKVKCDEGAFETEFPNDTAYRLSEAAPPTKTTPQSTLL